jgi:hypothetical protein
MMSSVAVSMSRQKQCYPSFLLATTNRAKMEHVEDCSSVDSVSMLVSVAHDVSKAVLFALGAATGLSLCDNSFQKMRNFLLLGHSPEQVMRLKDTSTR